MDWNESKYSAQNVTGKQQAKIQSKIKIGQLNHGGKDACKTYVVLHSPESHSLLASAVVEPTEFGGPRRGFFHSVELSHAALGLDHGRGVQQFGEHRGSKLFTTLCKAAEKRATVEQWKTSEGKRTSNPTRNALCNIGRRRLLRGRWWR
jgi:hypothetical protein